ncbi:glycine zipper 2TM domain-containing protein [Sandarakinorhabdus rubra]|nr:glycine zipper 2TM domain-containing protein [Sandarakinorhabdus rubra]
MGGVIGNQVARREDRTVATVAGAVIGGLVGRSIDRGRRDCRNDWR